MRSARRILPALLSLLFAALPAGAAPVELSLSTSAGALYGVTQELVYDWSTGSRYLLSELDWQLEPLFLWGLGMGLKVDNGLTASLDVQAGLPIQTGYIEDSDWLNMDAAHTKTHFSRHENHTEQALLLDARLGWSLPLARGFSLEPFAQFGFMHFKFTARDGYLQYPPETAPPYTPWSSSISQVAVYGTGIAYQQEWLIPAIGVLVGVRLGDRASMSASFSFSPLVSCFDLDNHFLRSLDFYESMTGGLLFEPRLLFAWRLAERVSLSADISYRLITGAMGVSYEVATGVAGTAYTDGSTTWHAGDWWSVPNGGGSAFSAAKALIMLSVTP